MQTFNSFSSNFLATVSLWSALEIVIVVLLLSLALALMVLVVAVWRLHQRLKDLAAPIFDKTVHEAQQKAEWVLVDARQQAIELRLNAQKEADNITKERVTEEEAYRTAARKHIEELAAHAQELLKDQATTITQLTQRIGTDLTQKAQAAEGVVADESETLKKLFAEEHAHFTATFASIEQNAQKEYEALIAGMQKQMTNEIAQEIDAARKAIGKYREEKLALVQQEIVGLVEDTARLSLGKTLSLEEHKDIVLKALSDAKAQGIFNPS